MKKKEVTTTSCKPSYSTLTGKKEKKDKLFKSPEDLYNKALEYFKWCEENPIYKHELMRSGPLTGKTVTVAYARPYTFVGFSLYVGSYDQAVHDYTIMSTKAYPTEWQEVGKFIRNTIANQQISGGLLEGYNPMLIARMHGLYDGVRIDTKKSSQQRVVIDVDDDKLAALIDKL